jgi:hypothetical protein
VSGRISRHWSSLTSSLLMICFVHINLYHSSFEVPAANHNCRNTTACNLNGKGIASPVSVGLKLEEARPTPPANSSRFLKTSLDDPRSKNSTSPRVNSQKKGSKIVRTYKLFNRCSEKHVRVTGKRVDASAEVDDQYSLLRFETKGRLGNRTSFTIQSASSQNFLCFNKLGKLVVKATSKDPLCSFHEQHDGPYAKFYSTRHAHWFVAFNKHGRRLEADHWTRNPSTIDCLCFVKSAEGQQNGGQPGGPRNGQPKVEYKHLLDRLKSKKSKG